MTRARPRQPAPRIALALAGGGPLGAIYEIGALCALDDTLIGLDLNACDHYLGVSAGGFISAALANGITAPPAEVAVSPTLTRTAYGAEGQPGEVTLLTSRGAGHTWPGGHLGLLLSLFLGRTSREIDATKSIWEFGLRHADDP